LDLKVLPPTLARTAGSGYRVSREGGCLLELAPAVAAKSYDWGAKNTFFLAVNELGTFLVSFGPGGNGDVSLFHDPNAGTPLAGTDNSVYKKLKATRMPDGNVMMNVSSGASSLSIPIASNEMAVMLEVFRYTSALPGAQLQGRRAEVDKQLSRSTIASSCTLLLTPRSPARDRLRPACPAVRAWSRGVDRFHRVCSIGNQRGQCYERLPEILQFAGQQPQKGQSDPHHLFFCWSSTNEEAKRERDTFK